jgi:hypothetical protein
MTYTQEKIAYGVYNLAGAAASTVGAILTDGEARWLYVTITASILTAGFLALVFKKLDESIRIVIGRSGLAILGGVLGSRYIVHRYGIAAVDGDVVALAGVAAGVCIASFIVGYPLLQLVNSKSGSLAKKLLDKWLP